MADVMLVVVALVQGDRNQSISMWAQVIGSRLSKRMIGKTIDLVVTKQQTRHRKTIPQGLKEARLPHSRLGLRSVRVLELLNSPAWLSCLGTCLQKGRPNFLDHASLASFLRLQD